MNFLKIFIELSKNKKSKIGIGLSDEKEHNIKILKAIIQFLQDNDSHIYLFGNQHAQVNLINENEYKKVNKNIVIMQSEAPEKEIIHFLKEGSIDAAIRGSLSSSKFLKYIKKSLNVTEINRLTLLETFDGYQFFYGPVGIDECNTFERKKDFIQKAITIFNFLKITPKISILSGGRKDDIGRDGFVDKTIEMAEKVVEFFKKESPSLNICYDEILIENSIKSESNLIIAPEGISGNLIYRTLVHLGGGKAHGAIYMGFNKIIIDTSRVGNISEITGALYLALALK